MNTTIVLPQYDAICDAFRQYGVSYAALFGSRAFGDNRPESDYDIVVEFLPESKTTLLGMIELKLRLKDLLGADVDLVTKRNISPYIRDSILSSVTPLYGQEN
ncbi:MAG: nucleotidyltransferase family protein [Candidatus Gottesmanbacteria bacterium]|nr:nucleotidyltransferase family protein [Candidatus Gottesmanbacteria bacterium]